MNGGDLALVASVKTVLGFLKDVVRAMSTEWHSCQKIVAVRAFPDT